MIKYDYPRIIQTLPFYQNMAILSVFILNKAGGLIYHNDRYSAKNDVEKTFSYPLDIVLKEDDKLTVVFGERDSIKGKFK